jgi:hypothetical protein
MADGDNVAAYPRRVAAKKATKKAARGDKVYGGATSPAAPSTPHAKELDRLMRVLQSSVEAMRVPAQTERERQERDIVYAKYTDACRALKSFGAAEVFEWSRAEWLADWTRDPTREWGQVARRYREVPKEVGDARWLANAAAAALERIERRYVLGTNKTTARERDEAAIDAQWVRDALAVMLRATEPSFANDEAALRLLFLRCVDALAANGFDELQDITRAWWHRELSAAFPARWERVASDVFRVPRQDGKALLVAWRNTGGGRRGPSKFALAHAALVHMWGPVSVGVSSLEDQWRKFLAGQKPGRANG